MNVFYCPDIASHEATLSPEESAHCIRVLRLGRGEKVQVIDGKGGYYAAEIADPDAKKCRLEILATLDHAKVRNYKIKVAIAPTKNLDRFEWFIEKSVEIGIDMITPLLCQRSERRVLKTDRLHKLILSTMKQAIIPFRPVLDELTAFNTFVVKPGVPKNNRFIAHCEDTGRKKLMEVCKASQDIVVLIGPEGDFAPEEISFATDHGFIPVSLGVNRLRTETAGVVACHTINILNDLMI
jgi:16S rRNA (uracil1498-N3)-methyltransferase